MSEVNIRWMAREMKLSISTISKALNDSHEISIETKRKVLELANQLHYTPNPYASSLRRKKSNTIAIVIPEVADSYFSLAINGIETVAMEKEYHVIVYLTHENAEREASILKDLSSGRVDGVLMSVSSETENFGPLKELHARKIPIVFFDRICEEIPTATVTTNDFESGYSAAKHLMDCGCKKITYLSISNQLSIINTRMEGYKKAIADEGNDMLLAEVVQCSNEAPNTKSMIRELLLQEDRPDGIIASVEKLATPVYENCHEIGIHIPNQLKMICFSNLTTATILNPPLTTITQPAFDMGKTAAEILFKALTKRNYILKDQHIVIPSELIIRTSAFIKVSA
ncbi:MAG: LacI family DNA-binding transcriptional regulator [Bacteroidota bacterium]